MYIRRRSYNSLILPGCVSIYKQEHYSILEVVAPQKLILREIKMKIAYDLDGTLYDALPIIFGVDKAIRNSLGYPPISKEAYVKNFQTKDWKEFYRGLGIREEDIDKVIDLFFSEFAKADIPLLVPGAKRAVIRSEKAVGHENIYIISNELKERVRLRFERDGLASFLPNVRNPFEGKSNELYNLAIADIDNPLVYVGDLVSDGEECKEAIERGASNIRFYGMLHPQAMNTEEAMNSFVERNTSFAKRLKSLDDVGVIWSQ